MKKCTVRDLGRVVTGHTPPTSKREFYGDSYLFLKPTDMTIGQKYVYDTEEGYSDLAAKTYQTSLIPKDSTCVVCIGTLGEKMAMAHCDLFTNQSINSIIPDENYDPHYVYYLIKHNLQRVKALNKGTASGREFVSKTTFLDLELDVVEEIHMQRKIGQILSAYDDLIENNQKQIKLLEEAAQRLYKEWFIDLRFPGHESTPIINGTPKGWKRSKVEELIGALKRTKQIQTSEYQTEGRIPVIDQSREFIAGYTDDIEAVIDVGRPIIVFGDHTRVLKYIPFAFARGADGTQLVLSNDSRMPQSLLYCSLKELDLTNYHYARHFKHLKASTILVPSFTVANEFDNMVETMLKKIDVLRQSTINAQRARDALLPRIMSITVEV